MGTNSVKDRARSELTRLAAARLDNDEFRQEAAALLRRAVGFDGWCWMLTDPAARLPIRGIGENLIVNRDIRRFTRILLNAWEDAREQFAPRPVAVLSVATGGDLSRDRLSRDFLGPAGAGDLMSAPLVADGVCWAQLYIYRDGSGRYFTEEDAGFVAGVAPMLAARLRGGLRGSACYDDAFEPGTIIVDQELSVVAATQAAWDWIDRLGLERPNDAEPLPGFIYGVAMRVAMSRPEGDEPPRAARVRLQAADGRWALVRVAPLVSGAREASGYAVTLEPARSKDLIPLLMRAWLLTPREREVASLVVDGLSSEDIARVLFISWHTARDHIKAIFAKTGVSRRQDLVAALAGYVGP